ncbi:TIGR00282 family metallophosphoesterase [Balneolaceae bacterium ANBcel3]|nr:TIGR00282 family metallophosphoesterase [Balneolaceae bacterium ANBcel3]
MSQHLKVLFIGDIVGSPGLSLLETLLPSLLSKHEPHFVIANAENSHEGMGINEEIIRTLYGMGVHVITGGNHSFAKWKIYPYMKTDPRLLRPFNYPKGAHGFGYGIYDVPDTEWKIGVLNLQGRTYMQPIDDPFRAAERTIETIQKETSVVFIDFHGEATAEKMAFGWFVDGKASVVAGTHTHIPTNDARILPKGTGYITDVGMTGPYDSVIGMDKETAIKRFLIQTPHRYKTANGDNRISALLTQINPETGKCVKIEPIIFPGFETEKSS